ncbi:hypothetical protein [Anaeromicropila herbilytica]|uniref:Uncharacterized protein n=1 Tax=Anaeromicropila herbilytica TaxID=2785025 RepID=A0A7R7EIT1_9FIRM|nr:hypothetical protein [Anaeromicropila herbilytica]BCN29514.1 hypothetical protein bsdtb5_08090 [Anaeromicropila herbilytica]
MNNFRLFKLIGAVGQEQFIIASIINEFGFHMLLSNIDSLSISNKTKIALQNLNNVIKEQNLVQSVSGLTEISIKKLNQYIQYNNLIDVIRRPESLDVDVRQFEKLRLLHEIMSSCEQESNEWNISFVDNEMELEI